MGGKKAGPKTLPLPTLDQKGTACEPRQQSRKQLTAACVAEDLGVAIVWLVTAMIVHLSDRSFAVFVVPGDRQPSLEHVANALGDQHVPLAPEGDGQRLTGYQTGAVSLIG